MKHQPLQIGAIALLMSFATLTYAASNAAVVIPVEGNPTCKTYAKNQLIKQINYPSSTSASPSADFFISTDMTTASFTSSTVAIDFAILKSKGNGALFMYKAGGVATDADMQVLVPTKDKKGVEPGAIDSISLCYGLEPYTEHQATIPSCSDVNADGTPILDGLGITCPLNKKSIIFNFELGNNEDGQPPFYNTETTPFACVCNSEALQMCDPNKAYPEAGACPQPVGDKTGAEVTTHIELNNDPYVCSTAGGIRTCFSY
jgi:hypothetical protein